MKSKISILIFLITLVHFSTNAQGVKVLTSTPSSITFEYSPNYIIDTFRVNGTSYLRIDLKESINFNSIAGLPNVPSAVFNIGVPAETGNTVSLLSVNTHKVSGKILPVPEFKKLNNVPVENYSENDNYRTFKNDEFISFGEFGLMRNLRVQKVIINPILFDSPNQVITIADKIIVQVNFARNSSQSVKADGFLKDVVINFDAAEKWGIPGNNNLGKINNSLLADGTWYKFGIQTEGIYRINRSDLNNYGIDPNNVDPQTIKIFNNGGYTLPERVTDDRPDGLVENAIYVSGEGDGSFDDGDYILFYARGPVFWEYNDDSENIERRKNLYTETNYYFITSGGSSGKRMQVINSGASANSYKQTSTKAFLYKDDDNINLIKSGRVYFGDEFTASDNSRTYTNSLTYRVDGSPINYTIQFANTGRIPVLTTVRENNTTIIQNTIYGSTSDYVLGRVGKFSSTYSGTLPDNRSVLNVIYNASGSESIGYLDYWEIGYEKELYAVDNILHVYSEDTTATVEYTVSNFSNSSIRVFNVSDYSNVSMINGAVSGGQVTFSSNETNGSISKYIALNTSKYLAPESPVRVENSNIRGISEGAKQLVIAHRNFSEQAERYALYRSNESRDPLSVQLVYIDQVFNEFSSGIKDPTAIRDFISYAYNNWNEQPFYVLLFGDGDYDYLNKEGLNNNFIPTYQVFPGNDYLLYELSVYPTDDYFARVNGNDSNVDVAIGRLNVRSTADAEKIVDKIVYYENQSEKGIWRHNITMVADDGLTSNGNDGSLHTRQSEEISKIIPGKYILDKLYLSNFPTVASGLGRRKPGVNQAIIDNINNGTLIVNFVGHGNPEVWTHEAVFEKSSTIPQLDNKHLFFLTAATCDFGKYDDPGVQSATEEMIMMESKGMIGGFTATRPVFASPNHTLNRSFYTNLITTATPEGLPVTIGTAYLNAKLIVGGSNTEKFQLYGDPAMRLNIPRLQVSVDSINGTSVENAIQISALSEVNISGSVKNFDGSVYTGYNGEGIVSMFDSERSIYLEDINYTMTIRGGLIFRGRVSIEGGYFNTSFTVPKDISYENKNGKVVAYVLNDDIDGLGFTDNFTVGGTSNNPISDNEGPEIEIFFDDLSSQNSYLVGPNTTLLVNLSDETGLNTTGTGVGHMLQGIIDDDEENPIDLTPYFIGDLDAGGKSGTIEYRFTGLETGNHKISISAWDVLNNSSEEEKFFSVVNDDEIAVQDVYNYPNPFASNTMFTFQHNLSETFNVTINIYTISGRKIKAIEKLALPANNRFVKIPWDGTDQDGDLIANGTYLYKLIINTVNSGTQKSVLGKLAVIR